jgi:hypothetical protein
LKAAWGGRAGIQQSASCYVLVKLDHKATSSAGFLEDLLVESGERVEEPCSKFVRGYRIDFLELACGSSSNRFMT